MKCFYCNQGCELDRFSTEFKIEFTKFYFLSSSSSWEKTIEFKVEFAALIATKGNSHNVFALGPIFIF